MTTTEEIVKGCTIIDGFANSESDNWKLVNPKNVKSVLHEWSGDVYIIGHLCVRGKVILVDENGEETVVKTRKAEKHNKGLRRLHQNDDGETVLDNFMLSYSYRELMDIFIDYLEKGVENEPLIYRGLTIIDGDLYIHHGTKIHILMYSM